MRLRFPMKLQIAILMFFFVVVVGVVAFRSTTHFLEEDKISTVRELHSLQVSQSILALQENLTLARQELQSAAIALLNPNIDTVSLNPKIWEWVRVRGKVWRSPEWKGELPPVRTPKGQTWSMELQGKDSLFILEPVKVREGKVLQETFVEGSLKKQTIFSGLGDYEDRGMKLVIMDFSNFRADKGFQLKEQVLFASTKALEDLKRIFNASFKGTSLKVFEKFPSPATPLFCS